MRNIVILILIIVALAIVRSLISDVSRAVSKAMGSKTAPAPDAPGKKPEGKQGRFVRDPQTGAYVDEATAVHATIDGKAFFFESESSRDAFLRTRTKA